MVIPRLLSLLLVRRGFCRDVPLLSRFSVGWGYMLWAFCFCLYASRSGGFATVGVFWVFPANPPLLCFAGAMSALRNPTAHSNDENLTAEEAMRQLMFASMLIKKIYDSVKNG